MLKRESLSCVCFEILNMSSTATEFLFENLSWSLGLGHWDDPEGWYGEGGGRGGSGLGTCVHPWRIHVDVWQNQYNIVK